MAKKTIVYLEDHKTYQWGVCQGLQEGVVKFQIKCFNHPSDALAYIENAFTNRTRIDLIITDFTQKVSNGYQFASMVKTSEGLHGIHTPILLLSMLEIELKPQIRTGLTKEIFDMYVSKFAPIEEIRRVVEFLTGTNARD